jgi:lipid-A-disaccharide synthase
MAAAATIQMHGGREGGLGLTAQGSEPDVVALSPEPRALSHSIAVFAGEPSGDLQGAALCAAMQEQWRNDGSRLTAQGSGPNDLSPEPRALSPELTFWGIGASRLRAAGAELIYDSSGWGAMGLAEALKIAPRLLLALQRVKRELKRRRPALVILIDFGAFNVKVAAAAKKLGLRVLYYFPPGSWRRHPRAVGRLPEVVDRVVTPFEWSEKLLLAAGVDAHCVGHPLVDQARPSRDRTAFCAGLELKPQLPIVCYLPGSRGHEIRDIWPAMAGAARLLSDRDPRIQHVVVQAPGLKIAPGSCRGRRTDLLAPGRDVGPRAKSQEPGAVVTTDIHDALSACDLAVTKAGSVTLEVMLHKRPMVVMYRGSWLQELEYHLWQRRRIKFIAMPNILADRAICPELTQHEASPEQIASLAWELLTVPETREKQIRGLREVAEMLGPPGAVNRAAALALEMLKS